MSVCDALCFVTCNLARCCLNNNEITANRDSRLCPSVAVAPQLPAVAAQLRNASYSFGCSTWCCDLRRITSDDLGHDLTTAQDESMICNFCGASEEQSCSKGPGGKLRFRGTGCDWCKTAWLIYVEPQHPKVSWMDRLHVLFHWCPGGLHGGQL